ncbi:murein biosynthesis integral membrane protein MurJ [Paratractidigestivibacter sp.]|uniref:murein biosynthesis integral membrane protein MurJ n=2 Tax=Paratractidigestivibacter sp. TaxID=2847316 RepID=UPI002AC8B54A|nr:murein biosynthesis integral membrane protein MurJ [Paratractidigestivibacter sp.]
MDADMQADDRTKPFYVPKHLAGAGPRVDTGEGATPALEAVGEAVAIAAQAPAEGDEVELSEEVVKEQVGRSSNMVSILVIISRITGFLRTSVQAWALGAAGLASAYTVANNLPNMLYEFVCGGMLITAFLPVYLSVKKKLGREGSSAYASNLLSIVVGLMVIVTVVSLIFAAPIIWTQSAGATEGFDSDLAVWFFRWFACEIVLYALSSIISGVLNAERDYFWSNLAPIFNNVITIGSFVAYGYLTQELGVAWREAAVVLAIGNPLGVAVQVFCQMPALARHGVHLTPRVNFRDPALKDTVTIGLPTIVATLASVPTTAVASSCALSVTAAGASISYYARVWYVLPYSIFAIPISVTMFTELSASWISDDKQAYIDYLADGMKKILFTIIPCSMLLIVFAPALIAVFGGGQFDTEAASQTAEYLQALSLALPFYALSSYLQKACSSMMRMNFYAFASVVASILQVVVCIWFTPVFGLLVVPVSSVLFYGIIDVFALARIRAIVGGIGASQLVAPIIRSFVFGAIGSVVGFVLLELLEARFGMCYGAARGLMYSAAAGIPAILACFGLASLLHMSDAPFFDSIFSKLARLVRRGK